MLAARQRNGGTRWSMYVAVPAVSIMENQVRRIIGTKAHAHDVFDRRVRTNDGTRVEHVDRRRDGEKIKLLHALRRMRARSSHS